MGLMRKLLGEAFHSKWDNQRYRASFALLDGLRTLAGTHGIDVRTPTYKMSDGDGDAPRYQGIPQEGFDEIPELYLSVENGLCRVDLHVMCFVHAYGFQPYREYVRKKLLGGSPVAVIHVDYPYALVLRSDTVVDGVLDSFKQLSYGEDSWRTGFGHASRLKGGFWSPD